ncbi:MAG: hypothetical protein U5N55_05420 [Cypionkella sp.]|nr:hypothetical protein [Cypionkella sp.]
MINQDVIDLHDRVADGAKVVVLNADGSYPTKLSLPPPAPKPKKAEVTVAKATTSGDDSEMSLNPALLPKTSVPDANLPVLKALPVPNFGAAGTVSRAATTP